jgi:hypothetical protein
VGYIYSDLSRESDPHALPDVEVYYFDGRHQPGDCWSVNPAGWYYAYGFPGCLWDSEPEGPFRTEAEAIAAAREWSGEGD